jgi:hypothetical protein
MIRCGYTERRCAAHGQDASDTRGRDNAFVRVCGMPGEYDAYRALVERPGTSVDLRTAWCNPKPVAAGHALHHPPPSLVAQADGLEAEAASETGALEEEETSDQIDEER